MIDRDYFWFALAFTLWALWMGYWTGSAIWIGL